MNLKNLLRRSQNLLLNPSLEFGTIFNESPSVIKVNKNFSIYVSIFIAVCTLINSLISNINSPLISFIFIGINAILVFLLVLSHIYLSGKSINLLGRNISNEENSSHFYSLSAYSQIPFFLILGLIKLFPSLVFLVFIGLYSALLLYTGTGIMTKIPVSKRVQFTILSMLIIIVSFILCSELFTILYSEILEQFTTFEAL